MEALTDEKHSESINGPGESVPKSHDFTFESFLEAGERFPGPGPGSDHGEINLNPASLFYDMRQNYEELVELREKWAPLKRYNRLYPTIESIYPQDSGQVGTNPLISSQDAYSIYYRLLASLNVAPMLAFSIHEALFDRFYEYIHSEEVQRRDGRWGTDSDHPHRLIPVLSSEADSGPGYNHPGFSHQRYPRPAMPTLYEATVLELISPISKCHSAACMTPVDLVSEAHLRRYMPGATDTTTQSQTTVTRFEKITLQSYALSNKISPNSLGNDKSISQYWQRFRDLSFDE